MAITISSTEPRVQYTATSGQTSFTVGFEFFIIRNCFLDKDFVFIKILKYGMLQFVFLNFDCL